MDVSCQVKTLIGNVERTEERSKKWISMIERDCNRFCKLMVCFYTFNILKHTKAYVIDLIFLQFLTFFCISFLFHRVWLRKILQLLKTMFRRKRRLDLQMMQEEISAMSRFLRLIWNLNHKENKVC